jgi:hypothetical protein
MKERKYRLNEGRLKNKEREIIEILGLSYI